MPIELKFQNGSVWIKAVQIHVANPKTGRHDAGKWVIFFSFSMPGQIFYGETFKDTGSMPMLWNTDSEGISNATERFRQLLD